MTDQSTYSRRNSNAAGTKRRRPSSDVVVDGCPPRRKPFIPKAKKSLRFSPTCDITFVENIDADEIDSNELWYSEEEFRTMRQAQAQTVRTIHLFLSSKDQIKNKPLFDVNILLMGLENLLLGREVRDCRRRSMNAVLDEQERQDDMGIIDPDNLARVSQFCSIASVKKAREIGISHSR